MPIGLPKRLSLTRISRRRSTSHKETDGVYRVGTLARLNVADSCGTPLADAELAAFRKNYGAPAHSAFLYHHAQLIEIIYALERIEKLLSEEDILSSHVRATAGVISPEGMGIIEAPHGVLIHHYKVNDEGAIVWANLIVATGHNNRAMGRSVQQGGAGVCSRRQVRGRHAEQGLGSDSRLRSLPKLLDSCDRHNRPASRTSGP